MFSTRQKGITLIEIMIGLLVGAIITTGAINMFSNNLKSSTDNLNLTKLNQDMRAMMDIMVRDIRRAGYVTSEPELNDNLPATATDGINDALVDNRFREINVSPDGSCVVYMYNRNYDTELHSIAPVVDANESLGFRQNGTDIQLRTSVAPDPAPPAAPADPSTPGCNQGSWQTINEPEVEVTQLQFALLEKAYNITSMITPDALRVDAGGLPCLQGDDNCNQTCDDGEACRTCTLDGAPDPACIFTRSVAISLTARLVNDNTVSQTITEEVSIRNEKYVAAK